MAQAKAVFKVPEPDEMVVCPFDAVHIVQWKRFHGHVLKCQANHPNSKLRRCPFHALHYISPNQYEDHVANCPYAQAAFSEIASSSSIAALSNQPYYTRNPPISSAGNDEDWNDDDRPQNGVVERLAAKPTMLGDTMHKTKSQKRKIREKLLSEFETGQSPEKDARSDSFDQRASESQSFAARSIMSTKAPGRGIIELPDEWLTSTSTANPGNVSNPSASANSSTAVTQTRFGPSSRFAVRTSNEGACDIAHERDSMRTTEPSRQANGWVTKQRNNAHGDIDRSSNSGSGWQTGITNSSWNQPGARNQLRATDSGAVAPYDNMAYRDEQSWGLRSGPSVHGYASSNSSYAESTRDNEAARVKRGPVTGWQTNGTVDSGMRSRQHF